MLTIFAKPNMKLCGLRNDMSTQVRIDPCVCRPVYSKLFFYILMFEPDTKSIEHKHTQLHPYHREWQKEQVTTPQEQRPTEICDGTPYFQHLHL